MSWIQDFSSKAASRGKWNYPLILLKNSSEEMPPRNKQNKSNISHWEH